MKTYELIANYLDNLQQDPSFSSEVYKNNILGMKIHANRVLKNVIDFTKPYKNNYQPLKDAFLLFFLLKPLFLSIFKIVFVPFSLIVFLFSPFATNPKQTALEELKLASIALLSTTVGITLTAIQFALWPLMLLRIPVRFVITQFTNPDKLLMENNKGYKRLIEIYDATTDDNTHRRIAAALLIKSRKDFEAGQKTSATEVQKNKRHQAYARAFHANFSFPSMCKYIELYDIDHKTIVDDLRNLRTLTK